MGGGVPERVARLICVAVDQTTISCSPDLALSFALSSWFLSIQRTVTGAACRNSCGNPSIGTPPLNVFIAAADDRAGMSSASRARRSTGTTT